MSKREIKFERGADGEILSAHLDDGEQVAAGQGRGFGKGVLRVIANALRLIVDHREVQAQRLRSIEDRLARLDGGPDAKRARAMAYDAEAAQRVAKNSKPLGFPRPK